MKVETILNFGGFYYSHLDDYMDSCIDSFCEDNDISQAPNIDFKKVHLVCAKEYLCQLEGYLSLNLEGLENIDFKFISLNSPKYYNFETDTILCEVSAKIILRYIYSNYGKSSLIDFVNEYLTPKSGFMPFYSDFNHIKKENFEGLISLALDFILEEEDIDQSTILGFNTFEDTDNFIYSLCSDALELE